MSTAPVALITGSGKKRVGAVVAESLAQRGYSIALHYRTSASEAQETADRLLTLGGEVGLFFLSRDLARQRINNEALHTLRMTRC